MIKTQNRKWSPLKVALGILIVIVLIPYYQKPDLAIIYGVLFSVYLIITGISQYKKGVSEMVFGSVLLTCSLIWVLVNKLPLTSFETIFFIIIALLFITGGIFIYLGYIPEKWFKYMRYDFDNK
jgi:hypothetical protein